MCTQYTYINSENKEYCIWFRIIHDRFGTQLKTTRLDGQSCKADTSSMLKGNSNLQTEFYFGKKKMHNDNVLVLNAYKNENIPFAFKSEDDIWEFFFIKYVPSNLWNMSMMSS